MAIPKVHDCIALFLGSDKEYRKQFTPFPGAYYVSAGWVNEKVMPQELCKTCMVSPEERVVKLNRAGIWTQLAVSFAERNW